MIIKDKDIIQIKCILAGIEKKDINVVNQSELSRQNISKNTSVLVNKYFDEIDPAINKSVESLLKTAINYGITENLPSHIQVNDDGSKYISINKLKEKNEYIRYLEKELAEKTEDLKESRDLIKYLVGYNQNKQAL